MATLDRYLDAMVKHRANALVFKADAPVAMVIAGASKPVSSKPATEDQIVALLAEVLGPSYTPGLSGTRSFPYPSPSGLVTITVEEGNAGIVVTIEPGRGQATAPAPQPPQAMAFASPPVFAAAPAPAPARPAPAPVSMPAPAPRPAPEPISISAADSADMAMAASNVMVAATTPDSIDELFHQMLDMRASDMHLKSNLVPMVRVDGGILAMPNRQPLTSEQISRLVDPITPERNKKEYAETNDSDFAYELKGRARMRCNVFRDLAGAGAVFRQIPSKILTVEQLGVPKAVIDMCQHTKGLVVVTGPTGSGKSTTLAAMVDWINKNRNDHLITIEDPVEFVHKDIKCLVNQREIGVHTKGFKSALRAALREDPDIVLVGEMRDLETVAIAIETAETGHLVFGTLHTNTAPSTVDRLIDQFPTDRQSQIRLMLSESLKGVVAQTLLKKKGGGRVAALEILVVTSAVANLIREGKTFQIPSLMQTGKGIGMQTLNDAMIDLVKNNVVEASEAYAKAPNKKEFGPILSRAGFAGPWSAGKTDD
ncbi:MAG: type IV pilus twitching motility protein PilT [Deltaproteobacteria bacterium]|nr:type IV pilus twitching motility protein PilT [Deltaproteobacteria bacterium]